MNEYSQENNSNFQEKPCFICGSQEFIWGRTVGKEPGQWVYFRADDAFWGGGEKLYARKCKQCQNVQLFALES